MKPIAFSAVAALLLSAAVLAQTPAPAATPAAKPAAKPAPKADLKNGAVLAYTCTGCHGIVNYKNAYPAYRVPKIGGQSQVYLSNALKAYRAGERKHPTMNGQAASLTDQEILDLSTYISGYKAGK